MKRNTEKHSRAMIMANSLVGQGIGRSEAVRKAWALIKLAVIGTRAAGVTHGKRQKALERLSRYPSERVSVTIKRDRANRHDKNAVAVVVSVEGKGSYTVGYLPGTLAALVAPLIDAGKAVQARYRAVTGGFDPFAWRGLAIGVEV
jgi:ADP-ribosylglycohydrolase